MQIFVSGNWVLKEGVEASFIETWNAFLAWTSATCEGFRGAVLIHDGEQPRHFISLGEWESEASRDAWHTHPDFPTHLGACRALCEEFRGADYELVASVGATGLAAA